MGAMMRDECWKDDVSLEAVKMTHIQISTGSQYFKNERALDMTHQGTGFGTGEQSQI